jgi:hypothetical protein
LLISSSCFFWYKQKQFKILYIPVIWCLGLWLTPNLKIETSKRNDGLNVLQEILLQILFHSQTIVKIWVAEISGIWMWFKVSLDKKSLWDSIFKGKKLGGVVCTYLSDGRKHKIGRSQSSWSGQKARPYLQNNQSKYKALSAKKVASSWQNQV